MAKRDRWKSYVRRGRLASFSGEVFTSEPVVSVERLEDGGVRVVTDNRAHVYDAVVLATHAPDSLSMLADASPLEREVLGAFGFQCNEIALHTDESFMPTSRRAWASWNWYSETTGATKEMLTLTYWLNNLQKMPDGAPAVFETLNPHKDYAEGTILNRMDFEHPMFSAEAVAAQKRLPEIQGAGGVWYAGAWQRYGFHEDGLLSAVRVAEGLGATLPWGEELDASRTRELEPEAEPGKVALPVARRDPSPAPGSTS